MTLSPFRKADINFHSLREFLTELSNGDICQIARAVKRKKEKKFRHLFRPLHDGLL